MIYQQHKMIIQKIILPFSVLTDAYNYIILICMRSTLLLPDELVKEAKEISGISRITDLVREGLKALVEREARKRLIQFGGSDPYAEAAPRNRIDLSVADHPQP
jgi:hypothetical protein